ncbi:hypothetical protein PNQ29_08310 [Halobacterium salinarum]|uniref:hypothetical protein n=1 Tax=Halobacterium salinarum TaxID=2242 RepID=UPI002556AFE3|nr:hypothetical protein [Halobacterium salinarum]MDL0118795.1 hypothetical protein [Halobacterium salinarum]MDL0119732.1 hypothetical protein [Halobacterium salinarum]
MGGDTATLPEPLPTLLTAAALIALSAGATASEYLLTLVGFGGLTTGPSGVLLALLVFVGVFAAVFGTITWWHAHGNTDA